MPEYGEPSDVSEQEFEKQCNELGGEVTYTGQYSYVCDTDLGGMSYNPEQGVYRFEGRVSVSAYPENVRVHNTPFGKGGVDVEGIDHVDVDLTNLATNPRE